MAIIESERQYDISKKALDRFNYEIQHVDSLNFINPIARQAYIDSRYSLIEELEESIRLYIERQAVSLD
jgi:hypothetical protein